jgi:hypothetical protein
MKNQHVIAYTHLFQSGIQSRTRRVYAFQFVHLSRSTVFHRQLKKNDVAHD